MSGPDSACSCYLVEQDGFRLLLDLGTGAVGPLQRYAAPGQIDAVIVSHAHGDHWSDLTDLGYLRTLTPNQSPPLPVIGPSDLPAVLLTNPAVFAATVAEPGQRRYGPWELRMSLVEHQVESWATRIDDVLCYTSDTAPCAALDELANGCAVLLAEASGSDVDGPLGTHLTAGDAGRLAARSRAELLVLTHLRPWQDPLTLLAEAAGFATCPVILAHPGLRLTR